VETAVVSVAEELGS